MKRAFTLIELLIVVAIIAVLAAIAIPNMLEAQVRAKVSRARTDLRTLATAVETYMVDQNKYPPVQSHNGTEHAPNILTTPIAYVTSHTADPFRRTDSDEPVRRYGYHNVRQMIDSGETGWVLNDLKRYGEWRVFSVGPSQQYQPWMTYDPTNGTVSPGNVLRTHASSDGRIMYKFWDPANPSD